MPRSAVGSGARADRRSGRLLRSGQELGERLGERLGGGSVEAASPGRGISCAVALGTWSATVRVVVGSAVLVQGRFDGVASPDDPHDIELTRHP